MVQAGYHHHLEQVGERAVVAVVAAEAVVELELVVEAAGVVHQFQTEEESPEREADHASLT
jgi:hypothetical protein